MFSFLWLFVAVCHDYIYAIKKDKLQGQFNYRLYMRRNILNIQRAST